MRPLDPNLQREWLRRMPIERRRQKAPPNAERRSNTRFPIAGTDIGNHAIRGRVLDLSRAGMAIEAHEALRPGERYDLTLTIGKHVETLEARVLWCRLCETRRLASGDIVPVYRAGIARIRPAPEALEENDTPAATK